VIRFFAVACRLRFLVLFAVIGAGRACAADNAPPADATGSRWLRWLGPLAPQGTKLPELPSPLRMPDQTWTVGQALRRALQANPDVQVALASVQRQDGIRLQSLSAVLPHLSIVASADQRDPALIDRSAAELAAAGAAINPTPLAPIATRAYSAQAELRQPIFDGLAGWSQIKRMALLEKKASVDARDLYLRIASQVRQAFDATLIRLQIADARRDAVRDLSHLADVAQKRFTAGEISEFESLRAQTALRGAEADLAQAQADLARTEELLCRMLYIERPADGLKLIGKADPATYSESFETALQRASASRLDVRSAELQLEAAKMGQRVALAGYLPRLDVSASYAYRSSYYDVHRQLDGWTVGIVGRWDIFDGLQTAGQVRTQRAERRIAEIRLADAQKMVGSQLRELFAALEQSNTVMASHASTRDFGQRGLREARTMYDAGRISLEQVLNAEIAYRQALIGWLGAVFTHNTTIYQLDYATANESFFDELVNGRP
jgi:outer membrane protein